MRNVAESELFVYPNPTSGKVNVLMNKADFSQVHNVKLIDPNGRTLEVAITENEQGYSVDLSKLKLGMYIIQVQGDNFMHQSRVIKN